MKKLLLLVLCCISIFGMAQNDVTKFLGIPVDGNKSDMISKLKSKGFKQSPYDEDVLIGEFNGKDVNVYIITNNNKVCRIMVCDENTMDEVSIKIRFNRLCDQFENNSKYVNLLDEDQKIKEHEDILHEMLVNKKRYGAIFYQVPDTTVASYTEDFQSMIFSKYSKEQLENPSEEITQDLIEMATMYAIDKVRKKPVWFIISELDGEYYISMYYDNEYNRANGEDL